MKTEEAIFREIGGMWLRVDSREPNPPTLADYLNIMSVIIDDNTQFCRIVRYYEKYKEIIVYRAYNAAKVTITKYTNKYE